MTLGNSVISHNYGKPFFILSYKIFRLEFVIVYLHNGSENKNAFHFTIELGVSLGKGHGFKANSRERSILFFG